MNDWGPNFGEPLPGGNTRALREAKNRRFQSLSDDEVAEQMDNRNLPYRKGWPQLPPLPVYESRTGARDTIDDPQAIIEKVQVLCQVQNIQPFNIYFAFRVPEVKQENKQYRTLVVTTDLSDEPLLYTLIVQIGKHLLKYLPHLDISVEIIDHRVVHGLFSFAIHPSEEHLLKIWQPVFNLVLGELHRREEPWITIEMLHRGMENDAAQCPATVVITSPTAAKSIWTETILPELRWQMQILSPSLEIELLCGLGLYTASQGIAPDTYTYSSKVTMGSSIGQGDLEHHSGTAGGMVKLSDGATYAITNHHVVRNDHLDNLLTSNSSTSDENPFLMPGNPAFYPNKHRLTCPSNEDNEAFNESGKMFEQEESALEESQNFHTERIEFARAKAADRSFGAVHASSGLRTVKCERFSSNLTDGTRLVETGKSRYCFLLDWCLLAFRPGRGMLNSLPLRGDRTKRSSITFKQGQKCPQWAVMNSTRHNVLRGEVSVGKIGRTTGFTYGTINPVPTIINPETDRKQFKFLSETYGLTVEHCGHCMSFVGTGRNEVVDKGDSGSIVLHAPSGDWLGLIFGETRTKTALFTPIDLVFRDIEKVTGHKVVEPVFNPN